MPAITIVITTYNLEQYIDRRLRELSEQTMRDFDILLVDDASTDNTVAIVDKWRARFGERLQTIYLDKNLGGSALTRNAALESGRIGGDYVLFLDGDDGIERNMLETLLAEALETAADVVVCAYDRRAAENGCCFSTEMQGFPREIMLPPQDDSIAFINPAPWNKLWRREIIRDLRFPDIRVGEEIIFNFHAFARSKKIRFTDQVLIHYLVHADSTIAGTDAYAIHSFAEELRAFHNAQTGLYKELAGFLAFLHIGLSMTLRAADNPAIDLKSHITETEEHFKKHYDWFRGNRFLKFSALKKRKLKGLLLWLALLLYRHGCFSPALRCYRALGLHIKF